MTIAGRPTIIRALNTGKETGLVATVWGNGTFRAQFQLYEHLQDGKLLQHHAGSSYSTEKGAIDEFNQWANMKSR